MTTDDINKGRVPELLVEKLALGELDEVAARDVRARLEREDGGVERLAAIERSNAEILEALPPAQVAHQIETQLKLEREQAPARRSPSRLWAAVPLVATAAAVALVVVLPRGGDEIQAPDRPPEVIRTKGLSPKLVLHRQSTTGPARLDDGATARAGDVLQVAYVAAGAGFGAIVSVDGNGSVTRHLPREGASAAQLERGGRVALDHAYELDDAPSHERFFFVVSAQPFEVDAVVSAARALSSASASRLALPAPLEQASFLVRKP
jgi:hypothetical protein